MQYGSGRNDQMPRGLMLEAFQTHNRPGKGYRRGNGNAKVNPSPASYCYSISISVEICRHNDRSRVDIFDLVVVGLVSERLRAYLDRRRLLAVYGWAREGAVACVVNARLKK